MGEAYLKGRSALGELVKHVAEVLSRQCLGSGLGCKGEELSIGRKVGGSLTKSQGTR